MKIGCHYFGSGQNCCSVLVGTHRPPKTLEFNSHFYKQYKFHILTHRNWSTQPESIYQTSNSSTSSQLQKLLNAENRGKNISRGTKIKTLHYTISFGIFLFFLYVLVQYCIRIRIVKNDFFALFAPIQPFCNFLFFSLSDIYKWHIETIFIDLACEIYNWIKRYNIFTFLVTSPYSHTSYTLTLFFTKAKGLQIDPIRF